MVIATTSYQLPYRHHVGNSLSIKLMTSCVPVPQDRQGITDCYSNICNSLERKVTIKWVAFKPSQSYRGSNNDNTKFAYFWAYLE